MLERIPYCGIAPTPAEILHRFNLDARLILVVCALALWHMLALRRAGQRRTRAAAAAGWVVTAAALISPLCALSVALFSARVAQHMLLVLVAAPLLASALPRRRAPRPRSLWAAAVTFFAALWFWHMPVPYAATFAADGIYWSMHVTLFGSALLLWRELLDHPPHLTAQALAAGAVSFVHMGLLGAVLALAERPLYLVHLLTTRAWGLSPLEDQQLGGALMWVPGIALFLWSALRSINRLYRSLERAGAA